MKRLYILGGLLITSALLMGTSIVLCIARQQVLPMVGLSVLSFGGIVAGTLFLRRETRERRDILALLESDDWDDWLQSNNYLASLIAARMHRFTLASTRKTSIDLLDKQAQISALQEQINPHFLYNTLESIRGQALEQGNGEIAHMAEALGAFFRYSISQKDYLVTLRDELQNVNNYFEIQRYRFEDLFSIKIDVEEIARQELLNYYLPKLTLQPLVENAVFHGLETKGEKGSVMISVRTIGPRLVITVSDDGVGMTSEALNNLNKKIESPDICPEEGERIRHGGIALVNVNRRIRLVCGREYGLQVYSTLGRGTDVEIMLPLLEVNALKDERREAEI